jgi:hypothetical protein
MLGQPVGDPAMQPLEFGPAHQHRDVVVAERGVGHEIQLDGVPMENRVAADRLVNQSLSHVLGFSARYQTLCDESRAYRQRS